MDHRARLLAVLLLGACSGPGPADGVSGLAFEPPPMIRRYSDAEIAAVFGLDLATLPSTRCEPRVPSVVPNGEPRHLAEVLDALGLDAMRLGRPRIYPVNSVFILTWRASHSFDLTMMSSVERGENLEPRENRMPGFLADVSPMRQVYGVRIVPSSRATPPVRP